MIIFNDSISKFYQCSIWRFFQGISMFFIICLGKKIAEVIKFLGILKNMSPIIKYIFVQERKAMFLLIKKLYFCLSHNFQTWFHNTEYLLHYPQCLCSHFILFFSLISASKKWNMETVLIFPYSYNRQKLTTTKWMKREARSIREWILNM